MLYNRKNCLIGTLAHLPCKDTLEVLGYAGFDFVIIDTEHSAISAESSIDYIRAAESADLLPLVRVPELDDATAIRKVLDNGAAGIVVPGICTAEQAKQAVAMTEFAPEGTRGACPMVRANQFYVFGSNDHYLRSNMQTAVMLLVEGKKGIENFDEILKVPGVDAIFLGPVDMAVSMGYNGDPRHPAVVEQIKVMIKKSNKASIPIGTTAADAKGAAEWARIGVDFILVSCDLMMYVKQANDTLNETRMLLKEI